MAQVFSAAGAIGATNATGAAGGIVSATRHVLSNGMVALVQRNPASPTVSIRGDVRVGAVHEPPEKAGLSTFTAAALVRGTARRTFQQISAETEERGGAVYVGGGLHQSGFSARSLAEDLPLMLDVLADVLTHPTFPTHEIDKLRGQFLMGLRESEQETQTQASRAVRALLYPPEHPYSRLSSGAVETVQHIGRDDLAAFHQHYHPAATTIAIVGDVEPEGVIAQLERYFGAWEPANTVPQATFPPVRTLQGIQRRDIAMSGKAQADVIWCVHGLKRHDPDYYAAMLGNMVLGRLGMSGRLGDNVRDTQGMAYYVYSGLQADEQAGPWAVAAGVNPSNVERALQAIVHEIEKFRQEGPTEQELSDVRAFLTGSLVLGLETNAGIAGTLLSIERYGLGLDYIARYPGIIQGVSHDDIVRVARTYLSVEDYALAVAGPPLKS
jgi:zinc protease